PPLPSPHIPVDAMSTTAFDGSYHTDTDDPFDSPRSPRSTGSHSSVTTFDDGLSFPVDLSKYTAHFIFPNTPFLSARSATTGDLTIITPLELLDLANFDGYYSLCFKLC
ncbi:hypothetical protein SARC_07456, partial [Sphaeroforma arctica JP610]